MSSAFAVVPFLLLAGAARATESASAHYRNVSLDPGQSAAPATLAPAPPATPAQRRFGTVLKPETAPAPAPAAVPPPAAPRPPVWPWAALAGAAAAAAAAIARRREARRAKAAGETLALAAHELKSPLAAIESYLDLMALDAPQDARGVRLWLEDVQRMKSTASHLRRTIGDILDMTRIEDGRLKLEPRAVTLAPLLAEAADAYSALARDRGVALAAEGAGAPDASADPDRLRQVLNNLIGNALKFTPSGGTIRVRAGRAGARAFIEVADDGVGVPPASRAKLFGKFARLAPALDDTEGTGLGLYISKRLVEAQGGELTYAPGAGGRGSVFRVSLPLAGSAA